MRSHRFLSALLGVVLASSVLAAPSTAAVYPPQQALPAQTVQQFLANPGALLTQFPNGGPDMIARVRDLAASDPATLNALVGLLSKANTAQATAIGTALGDVAKLAVTNGSPTDQAYAAQIQVAVAVANNDTALVAFNAVIGGDIQLTAVTGGVGGGGGGGGGPTTATGSTGFGSGPGTPTFTTAATNTADSFTLPGLSAGGPGSATTTITNTVVSP
jgi:hypothetical protein